MSDITQVFKSTIKMLKLRQKSVVAAKSEGDESNSKHYLIKKNQRQKDSSNTSRPNNHISASSMVQESTINNAVKDEANENIAADRFTSEAKQIVKTVTELKDFLLQHRRAYLAASSNIPLEFGQMQMTESERDKIDTDAMKYMQLCKETLKTVKKQSFHKHLTTQQREHRMAVFTLIENYLTVVCQIYSEQRAIRVKRAVDRSKISRLSLQKAKVQNSPREKDSYTQHTSSESSIFNEYEAEPDSEEISQEEAQLFKEENEQMYSDLNSTLDEVKQIEGKVVEITRLQEIFTDKVLEQEKDVDRISEALVASTENVVSGNQEIREAMKNNAGLRVWIIFGLCVLSFTLLFLDWYND